MNAYAPSGESLAHCIEEFVQNVDNEVRRAVVYVDKVVVPQVRKESSSALRELAGRLERLADSIHATEKTSS